MRYPLYKLAGAMGGDVCLTPGMYAPVRDPFFELESGRGKKRQALNLGLAEKFSTFWGFLGLEKFTKIHKKSLY